MSKRSFRVDLTGQKFGRLTVISWLGDGKWNCKCDCGNEVQVLTYNLRNGNTKSCGCYQRQRTSEASYLDMVGKRFGKLVVLERVADDRFVILRTVLKRRWKIVPH